LLILIALGIFGGLQLMELRAEEPRRAIVAMEMILSKNYTVPKIFGFNYYNKPPLFNWVLVLMFKFSGSYSEFWVRLPSIFSFFFTAFLVYTIVKRYVNRLAGFVAAILLLVSGDILFYGSVDAGEIDLFLTLLMFVQAIAIFHYSLKQKWWHVFILSYLFMAAGVLTKGLPPLLIQALLLLAWFVYIKQFKKLFSIQHIIGILIGGSLIYLYFMQYSKQSDVLLYLSQLLTESAQRSALGSKWGKIAVNILQSPVQVFYLCLPATALLLYAANKKVRSRLKGNKLFVFSLMFTLIICAIFFLSPETANRYIYPAFPFIAIMASIVYLNAAVILASSKWFIGYKALLYVCIFAACARIAYDVWGIPYQQKISPQNYRKLSAQILQHAGNNPIYVTGYPHQYDVHSFLFLQPKQDSINGATLLPYQIPYYITKATGTIMRYDSIPQKGLFYLTPIDFLKDKKPQVYFIFFDNWTKRDVVLVKF